MTIPNMIAAGYDPHPGLGIDTLDGLLVNGAGGWAADIGDDLLSADIAFQIDGTSNLVLAVEDPHLTLLNSPLTAQRSVVTVDGVRFVLAAVAKKARTLTLTFEHAVANALKQHTDPQTVAPGTMSRVDFVRKLAAAESWIKVVPPFGFVGAPANDQMSVGDPTTGAQLPATVGQKPESYWEAMGKELNAIAWRRFPMHANELWVMPDTWLYQAPAVVTLTEDSPGVEAIEFTADTGWPMTDVTLVMRCQAWSFPVGTAVAVSAVGVASGKYIVTDIQRSLFSALANVKISAPTPTLPEPAAQADATSTPVAGTAAFGLITGNPSAQVGQFLAYAQSKVGGPYATGGKGPKAYDCSGLVKDAAAQIGVQLPRYSVDQFNACVAAGGKIDVTKAIQTPGALLFHNKPSEHVAISRGDGTTIEAMNHTAGICNGNANGRGWTDAALLPGVTY